MWTSLMNTLEDFLKVYKMLKSHKLNEVNILKLKLNYTNFNDNYMVLRFDSKIFNTCHQCKFMDKA